MRKNREINVGKKIQRLRKHLNKTVGGRKVHGDDQNVKDAIHNLQTIGRTKR